MALDRQHWMVTVALVTSSLIAFSVNLLLLLVFYKRRGLRTISNRFTINLLFINLLSSVVLIPLLVVEQQTRTPSSSGSRDSLLDDRVKQELGHKVQDAPSRSGGGGGGESLVRLLDDTLELRQKASDQVLCYLAQSVVSLVCTASILSVLLIGVDQYFAVIHSLRYYSYVDKFRSSALISASWAVSLVFAALGATTQRNSTVWQFCADADADGGGGRRRRLENPFGPESIYAVVYFTLIILVPFLAICAIYVCICTAARNNSERMRQSTKHNGAGGLDERFVRLQSRPEGTLHISRSRTDLSEADSASEKPTRQSLPKVHSAPNFLNLRFEGEGCKKAQDLLQSEPYEARRSWVKRTSSERVGFISNLRCRISNASSVFRYREETRAAKVSSLVIFMVLVCYLPYGLAVLLNSRSVGMAISSTYNFVSLLLLVLANVASPFLFAYRNRRVRRELLRLFGLAPPKSPRVPRELTTATTVPQVAVTYQTDAAKKQDRGILKRVCDPVKNWRNYSKKCTFIVVPEVCWHADSSRGSFSSASTQSSVQD